jgi:hypothetical protein
MQSQRICQAAEARTIAHKAYEKDGGLTLYVQPESPGKALAISDQRVCPLEAGKSREVAICGAKHGPMFNGDSSDHCVHNERASGLAVTNKASQNVPMPFARLQYSGVRLREPRRHDLFGLDNRKRMLENAWVGANSNECPEDDPGKANKLRT